MIQRFLFMALVDGLLQLQEDPTILDQLFEELWELAPQEVEGIKTYFAANPMNVIHGYAPRDVKLPTYSIVMMDEHESNKFLNDDTRQVMDEESSDFGADVKGSVWNHTYHILTFTEHPDVASYYYEIAKSILFASLDFFADRDLFDIDISGGSLAPDPNYMPEHLFERRVVFRCERLFERVDRESKAGKAFQVGGIHIDKSGSPSDVGGVKTLITPIAPDELEE